MSITRWGLGGLLAMVLVAAGASVAYARSEEPNTSTSATTSENEAALRFSEPGAACATGETVHPSLPGLCRVWSGDGLPPMAKRVLSRVILRLANDPEAANQALLERCQQLDDPGVNPSAELRERCARLAAEFEERRVELCRRLAAARVTIPQGLAQRCADVLPAPTATATATALATLTATAAATATVTATATPEAGRDAFDICRKLLESRGQGNPQEVCRALLAGQTLPVVQLDEQDKPDKAEKERAKEERKQQQAVEKQQRAQGNDDSRDSDSRDADSKAGASKEKSGSKKDNRNSR